MKMISVLAIGASILVYGGSASAQRTWLGYPYCQSAPADILSASTHEVIAQAYYTTCPGQALGAVEVWWSQDFGSPVTYQSGDGCYFDGYDTVGPAWNDCHISCYTANPNIIWQLDYESTSSYWSFWSWTIWFLDKHGTDGRSYCETMWHTDISPSQP
jgi:hypothetical protein